MIAIIEHTRDKTEKIIDRSNIIFPPKNEPEY